jgi:formylglycine-generating enzyme required for sulfatase activity
MGMPGCRLMPSTHEDPRWTKNPGAQSYIPTENESYKAAYYSPVKGGPSTPGYYTLTTQSDSAPGNVIGSGTNQANYYVFPTGYSVTQSPGYSPSQNYLSDIRAFANSASYYGTFDQSGNVWEWNDGDATTGVVRFVRGGSWQDSFSGALSSAARINTAADFTNVTYGFRLASLTPPGIPEIDPAGMGSVLALVAGALGLCEQRRRP